METPTFLVLGGYGGIGRVMVRMLLEETHARVVVAGRDGARAAQVAADLAAEFPDRAVHSVAADAGDREGLVEVLSGVTMVLCCTSATGLAGTVAKAATEAGVDYLDIHFSQEHVPQLLALEKEIRAAGRCFITQAGFHPGLAAAFIRRAAPFFDKMESAILGTAMKEPMADRVSLKSLLRDIDKDPGFVYQRGEWRRATWRDSAHIDLGEGFGSRSCYPIDLYEMRGLPELHRLETAGVYVAGFNWFVDSFVIMPTYLLHLNRFEWSLDLLSRWFVWGLKRFIKPPFGSVFQLEAQGTHEGRERSVLVRTFHRDGYLLTVVPVIACLLQYLEGSIRRPGLWMMGHVVDPVRLLADMDRMGTRSGVMVDGEPLKTDVIAAGSLS